MSAPTRLYDVLVGIPDEQSFKLATSVEVWTAKRAAIDAMRAEADKPDNPLAAMFRGIVHDLQHDPAGAFIDGWRRNWTTTTDGARFLAIVPTGKNYREARVVVDARPVRQDEAQRIAARMATAAAAAVTEDTA